MDNLIKNQWPENLQEYKKDLVEFDFNPQSGVYFLFENNELIYIGKANDIYVRVLCHSNRIPFNKIYYIPVKNDIEEVETKFIQYFKPRLNITDNPDNQPEFKPKPKIPEIIISSRPKSNSIIPKQKPKYKLANLPEILHRAPIDILRNVLGTISNTEMDVIIKRHGLFGNDTQTLQEIGEEKGLTRERIRQIQKKGERKLLHPLRMNKLIDNSKTRHSEEPICERQP